MKRFGVLVAALIATCAMLTAQAASGSGSKTGEKTVEEAYLTQTYEGKMILQFATADTKGRKQDALLFIKEAIDAGRKNDDIQHALSVLSLDGTVNTVREGGVGRILNNFPDVRAEACTYLGQLGTEEAKQSLLKVTYVDDEPMVITEAIRSLGNFDNKDGRVTQAISSAVFKYDILGLPDNRLAMAALEAIEKLGSNGSEMDSASIEVVMLVSDGNYITPVKNKAKELTKKLTKFGGSSSKSSSGTSKK
jgi:hypothetical protein